MARPGGLQMDWGLSRGLEKELSLRGEVQMVR